MRNLMSKCHGFFARNIDRDCSWKKKNARLRTSQLPRAPLRWLWKFRKDLTRPGDLTFPLTRVVLYFSFPHLSYEKRITDKGILVCRPNRLHVPKNVIKTRCCKMRRSCDASSSFLLCCRDSSIPAYYHPSVFGESEWFIGANSKLFDNICFSNKIKTEYIFYYV